ncbi:probable tubulin polyglutamylase TTLL9 isoform X4 [Hippoglossus hippoglossus]|uniref:probable tubulin polyglutamylase TTLL9 isoform X4 n=1 Tax=Hippoglossus hippoglossus TaxID=8267 RepID=UPI00148CAA0E|nr:probable tubulin polyglutamylase TTLL9 isoform X4 [Hippoglossus hippoglossus]
MVCAAMAKNKTPGYKCSYNCGKVEEREPRSCVRFKCGLLNTIQNVLHQRPGWVEVKDSDADWDFNWCDVGWLRENFDHSYMEEHVRVNHFRNHYELTRKNLMVKNLKRYRKNLERDAGHMEASKSRKFDLRIYILVTSYVPLKAWLYRDGFARFSSTRFSLRTIDDKYMHLTNVAVQKTAPDYDPEKGCKWQMQQLRRYLTAKHGTEMVDTLFKEMDNIFVRSLQSVQKVIINDKHCFELYGYDVLLDQNLKPWLIEVNASPSHTPSSQEDYEMKCRLLEDTLNVVDMEERLTGKEKRVGGYDLMWNDGPVYREDTNLETFGSSCFTANTHLGCVNDREKQLRPLLKPFPVQKKM